MREKRKREEKRVHFEKTICTLSALLPNNLHLPTPKCTYLRKGQCTLFSKVQIDFKKSADCF